MIIRRTMSFLTLLNCILIQMLLRGVGCSSCIQSNVAISCRMLYVSVSRGIDSSNCGNISQPCKTLSVALRQAFLQNDSVVCLNISAGMYKGRESLKLDCTSTHLQRLMFLGERSAEKQVQTSASLDVTMCKVTFFHIHFSSPEPLLIKTFLSHLLLCNCSMKHTKFSIISVASSLEMIESEMSYCSGWKSGIPLLSVTSFPSHSGVLQLLSCTFSHNNGTVLFTRDVAEALVLESTFEGNLPAANQTVMVVGAPTFTLQGSIFIDNFGSLLRLLEATSMNLSSCTFSNNLISADSILLIGGLANIEISHSCFVKNSGMASGLVIHVLQRGSNVSIKDCEFKCNSVNRQRFVPPIQTCNSSDVICNNCSVDPKCPVACPGGTHLTNALMCESCDKGTFSSGSVGNSTPAECSRCPQGYFSSVKSSLECRPCEEGTISKPGSSRCVKCSNDFFTSARGESSCSRMKVGVIALTVVVCFLIAAPLAIMTVQHWRKRPRSNGSGPRSNHRKPPCDTTSYGKLESSIQS